jgi:hypothetical protein
MINILRIHKLNTTELMYGCLLPTSATVKMDNGENMENVRYARMMTLLTS